MLEFLSSQMIYEMMNEATSPGLATPGGSADLPLYGVNPFFS